MSFKDFEPIFGEVKAEWAASKPSSALNPFLIHVYAADASHLKFHVTDFHSSTWEAVRSSSQLDDMRDCIGIGGSWSDFMEYFISSLKSEDLKLVLDGQSKSNGATSAAKLVARKSRGMPSISVSLSQLMGSDAGDAMANLSLIIFRSLKDLRCSLGKDEYKISLVLHSEQERCCQLTQQISAEKEKSKSIKNQLDTLLYSKRQKLGKITPENSNLSVLSSDTSPVTGPENSTGKQQDVAEEKTSNASKRAVPTHRRTKVRGAVLVDSDED